MHLEFLEKFTDPYLQTRSGKGIFLAGVTLGMLALGQSPEAIDSAPIFKQLNFGRMKKRDVLKHMARVPELTRAYHLDLARMIDDLCAKSGEMLLEGKERDLGIDGNFIFSVAFLNARNYFWTIFRKQESQLKIEEEPNHVL